MKSILLVFLGGGLGSVCRYAISRWFGSDHYWNLGGTLLSNGIASLILGYLMAVALTEHLESDMRLLAAVGFCGGFSTFSTFSWEVFSLFQDGKSSTGFAYMAISLFVGLLFIWIGYNLRGWFV